MATLEGSNVNFTVMNGVAYINGVEIVTTDILTTNGVIHVIEEVLLPLDNIVATATANGSFTTLLAALDQAGLTSTLEGAGSFTVFAPTDDAFADLLMALDIDAATLLGIENLSDVLLYHVLDGAYEDAIKFLYIMGENPVVSDPDTTHVKKSLDNLDFLIVQDLLFSDSAEGSHGN